MRRAPFLCQALIMRGCCVGWEMLDECDGEVMVHVSYISLAEAEADREALKDYSICVDAPEGP